MLLQHNFLPLTPKSPDQRPASWGFCVRSRPAKKQHPYPESAESPTFAERQKSNSMYPRILLLCAILHLQCTAQSPADAPPTPELKLGAAQLDTYLPLLQGQRVAMVVNPTSRLGDTHLVDTLLALGVEVERLFAPEHGFRGDADAGEAIKDGHDTRTGLPIISLYGTHKKPTQADLAGIDWVIFDIQDVGARFYTYLSTLHYVMEASAEWGVRVLVLDRPNPNGHYVDGPVLEAAHRSFVGMHPVPVVHGMTVGEYARMIQGEGWLDAPDTCVLTVIPMRGYDHHTPYTLPIKPSPNLPNMRSIYAYPSLCFFEGTAMSVGRGTDAPFQWYGHPELLAGERLFQPAPNAGAKSPKHEGQWCLGYSLRDTPADSLRAQAQLDIAHLLRAYAAYPDKAAFFNPFFTKLAGTTTLQQQIEAGYTVAAIRASWATDLQAFKRIRAKYLLYPDAPQE